MKSMRPPLANLCALLLQPSFFKDLFLQGREGWVGMTSSPPPHDPQLNNRLALSPGVPPPLKNSGSAITTGIDHTRASKLGERLPGVAIKN